MNIQEFDPIAYYGLYESVEEIRNRNLPTLNNTIRESVFPIVKVEMWDADLLNVWQEYSTICYAYKLYHMWTDDKINVMYSTHRISDTWNSSCTYQVPNVSHYDLKFHHFDNASRLTTSISRCEEHFLANRKANK